MLIDRRQFHSITATALATSVASFGKTVAAQENSTDVTGPLETYVPCRAITGGPRHHWFGYYDKRQFDPSSRFVLANEVDFEGRPPTADDSIAVGYVDTAEGDRWVEIGRSSAWGWQQGCMLQWVGPRGDRIMWNDLEGDQFVCRVYSMRDGSIRTLPKPIYTITSDGKAGLSADFRRIDNLRPGYGYDGLADPYVNERAPEESGIWRIDLETGDSQLIISLAEVADIPWPDGDTHQEAWHYFNHLLINPSGTRFTVLHRYRPGFDPKTLKYQGGFVTRMLTADMNGRDRYVLDPSGHTSHFIWKNDEQLTMWTRPQGQPRGFYRFTDQTRDVEPVGQDKMPTNGHNTYLGRLGGPYRDWILNDTYPDDTSRQTVYLYHVPTGRRVDLGRFPSPPSYRGEWRCDTHPRSNDRGDLVSIDSPHDGGREVYLLDIRSVLQKYS